MSCQGCKTIYGDVASWHCAFNKPIFSSKNNICWTMSALRTLCDPDCYENPPGKWTRSNEEQSLFTVEFGKKFLVMGTCRARCHTETALVVDEEKFRPLRLKEAEEVLAYWRARPEFLKTRTDAPFWGNLFYNLEKA